MLRATAMAFLVVLSLAHTAEAASPFAKCIQKVQKKHKAVARVIPLEGVSKGLALQQKTDSRFLTEAQSVALTAAFDDVLKCREMVLRRTANYPDIVAVINDVFEKNDIVYIDLQQRKVNIGVASVALVNMRNEAQIRVKRIEAAILSRNAEEARRNSADGWKLMQQGLDMLYPPEPSTKPNANPSYTCRNYGGYTRCTPDN